MRLWRRRRRIDGALEDALRAAYREHPYSDWTPDVESARAEFRRVAGLDVGGANDSGQADDERSLHQGAAAIYGATTDGSPQRLGRRWRYLGPGLATAAVIAVLAAVGLSVTYATHTSQRLHTDQSAGGSPSSSATPSGTPSIGSFPSAQASQATTLPPAASQGRSHPTSARPSAGVGAPSPGPGRTSPPASPTSGIVVTVYNKVTDGPSAMREDTPAYLSSSTHNYCKQNGCALSGTDLVTGDKLRVVCQTSGDRTTNGQDGSSADDSNPGLYESTRWYGARWTDGRFGYISEVWISPSQRGGLGLPAC
ncbi:MAG: hypothetical protein QOG53_3109 [Frankiales bacterium]|jgi:hypothetical protein|nr:hypothetical protein [Frankiales bacterium]